MITKPGVTYDEMISLRIYAFFKMIIHIYIFIFKINYVSFGSHRHISNTHLTIIGPQKLVNISRGAKLNRHIGIY